MRLNKIKKKKKWKFQVTIQKDIYFAKEFWIDIFPQKRTTCQAPIIFEYPKALYELSILLSYYCYN